MAIKYWEGKADAVAQVGDFKITAYDVTTTYIVTIGDKTISTLGTGGTIATTITALLALLQASTHPYFSNITWSSPAADTIRGTANTAGVPFVATFTKTGGAGTVNAYAAVTVNSGPNDWTTANNWSDNVVPVNTDTVIFRDNAVDVLWGLDQSAVHPLKVQVYQSYTGRIGLDYTKFATSSSSVADAYEYRTVYLTFAYCPTLEIGENVGPGSQDGSGRILIDTGTAVASNIEIFNTASASEDTGRPAVRLKGARIDSNVFIRSAPGGVGIAAEIPGETSQFAKVSISDSGGTSTVQIGSGVTLTTFEQTGGNNVLRAAATIATVRCMGGTLRTEGDFTATLVIADGGTIYANHTKTAGSAITRAFAKNGGTIDGTQSNQARTWDKLFIQPPEGTAVFDALYTTVTLLGTGDYSEAAYGAVPQYQGKVTMKVTN